MLVAQRKEKFALRNQRLEVLHLGDHALARSQAEESVALFRREGKDTFGLTTWLSALGNVAMTQEDYVAARSALEESVAISRKSGDAWGLGMPLTDLGAPVFRQDDHERAEALLKESLTVLQALGERWFIMRSLELLAAVVSVRGDHERGPGCSGRGRRCARRSELPCCRTTAPTTSGESSPPRAGLAEENFAAAWAEGRTMTSEQAVEYALSETP